MRKGSVVADSVSSSNYSSYSFAGGLVGMNGTTSFYISTIINCYASGDVSSIATSKNSDNGSFAGGLVASNDVRATIINSYRSNTQSYIVMENEQCNYTGNLFGIEKNIEIIQSIAFQGCVLEWSIEDWNFVEGEHPTLKNVGTIN